MADLYSNNNDGWIKSSQSTSWATARDDTDGATVDTNDVQYVNAIGIDTIAARGGATFYNVYRSFLYFDTSGITGTVSAATIKIKGYNLSSGSAIVVKSTAFGGDGGTALATTDLDAITGYSAGSSLAGSATVYGSQLTSWNNHTGAYNDFTGSSDLKSDMQDDDVVIICIMNYTNDYLNSTPSGDVLCGMLYTDKSGTSYDPYIEYEVSSGSTVATVSGVAEASVATIKGVAHANIATINGVTFD